MRSFEYLGRLFQPLRIVAQGNSGASEKTSSPVVKTASDTSLIIPANLDLSFIKDEKTRKEIQQQIAQINAIPKRAISENKQNENDELFFAYTLVDLVKLFFKLKTLKISFLNVQMLSPSSENHSVTETITTIQKHLEKIKQVIPVRLIQSADAKSTSSPVEGLSLFTSIEENGKTALGVLQENDFLSNPPIIVFPNGKVTVLDPPQKFSLLKPSTWFTNWGKRCCEFANEFNTKCALISLPGDLLLNASTLQEALDKIAQISPCFEKTNNQLQALEKLCTQHKPSRLRTLFGFLSGAKNTRYLIESCEVVITEAKTIAKTKQIKIIEDLKENLVDNFKRQCENIFVVPLSTDSTEEQALFACLREKIKKLNSRIFEQLNSEIANQSAKLFVEKLDECFDKKVNAFTSTPNEKKLENLCNFCKQYRTEEQKAAINFIVSLLRGDTTLEPVNFRDQLNQAARVLSGEKSQEWIDKNLSYLFKTAQKCPDWLRKKFLTPEENNEIQKRVKVIISAFKEAHFNEKKQILTLDNNKQYPFAEWENLFQFVTRYCSENERSQFLKNYYMTRALYFFNEMFLSDINDQLPNKTKMMNALKQSIQDRKPEEISIFSRIINAIKAKGGKILCASANQANQIDNQSDMIAAQLQSIIAEIKSVLPKNCQSSLNSLDLALWQYGELKKTPEQILDQTLEDFKRNSFLVNPAEQEAQKKSLSIAYEFVKEYQSEISTSYRNQYKQFLLCVMIDNNSDADRKNFAFQLLKTFNVEIPHSQQSFWSELISCSLLELNKIDIIPRNIKACIDSVTKAYSNDEKLRKQYLVLELLKNGLIQEAVYVLQALAISKLEDQVFTDIRKHLKDVLKIDTTQLKSTDIKSLVNAILSAEPASVFHEMIKEIENGTEQPTNASSFLAKNVVDNMSSFISNSFCSFKQNKLSDEHTCTPWHYRQSLLQNNTNNKISNGSLEFVRDDNDTVRQNNAPLSIRYNYVLFLKTTADVLMCAIKNSTDKKETIKQAYCFMKKTLQDTRQQYENNNGNREPKKKTFLEAMGIAINILEKNINNRAGTPVSPGSNNTSPTDTPTNGSNSSLASKPVVAAEQPSNASVVRPNSFFNNVADGTCRVAQNLYNSIPSLPFFGNRKAP